MRLAIRRRDPYWDLDGRTVRRDRRLRKVLQVLVAWAIVALLVVVFRPMNVRAAGTGVNLDQWATIDAAWQNGDLNGSNAAYPEGGVARRSRPRPWDATSRMATRPTFGCSSSSAWSASSRPGGA